MDIRKIIMALLMVVLGAGSAAAHPVSVPRLYVFGFAASFNDSTVYITEVQTVDSAWIESNGGFLYNRGEYANQLRTYLKSIGKADETCVVFFATKESDILKQYVKLRKTYEQPKKKEREMRGRFLVTNVRTESFHFRSVPLEMSGVEPEKTKAERRAEKEAQKAARKAAKDGKSKKPHSMPKSDAPQQVMTIGEGKAS